MYPSSYHGQFGGKSNIYRIEHQDIADMIRNVSKYTHIN